MHRRIPAILLSNVGVYAWESKVAENATRLSESGTMTTGMDAVAQPGEITGTRGIASKEAPTRLSVLHVHSGNLFGGIERAILTCVENLHFVPSIHFEFALCFRGRFTESLAAAGHKIHELPEVRTRNPFSILAARGELKRLLACNRYDVVICHSPWSHSIFAPVIRSAGVPELFWAHDHFRGKHWLERWARRSQPDFVISNSDYTDLSVPGLFAGVSHQVLRCPIQTRPVDLAPELRSRLRAELDTPDNAVVIIQVSRMESWKGQDLLLEAASMISPDLPWVIWFVGGAERRKEKSYFAGLTAKANYLGIAKRVRFTGHRTDVPHLLSAADIFCQPNRGPEPFGLVFVEALVQALPVVTFDMGGPAEIIDDTCGVLVPPGNVEKLGFQLRQLASQPDRRRQFASAGPDRAKRLCDPALILPQLETILRQLSRRRA